MTPGSHLGRQEGGGPIVSLTDSHWWRPELLTNEGEARQLEIEKQITRPSSHVTIPFPAPVKSNFPLAHGSHKTETTKRTKLTIACKMLYLTLKMLDSIDNTRAERLANICFILCFHNPLRDRESDWPDWERPVGVVFKSWGSDIGII